MKKFYFVLLLLAIGVSAVLFYQEASLLDRAQPYKPGLSQGQVELVDRFNALDDTAIYTRIGVFLLLLVLTNIMSIAGKKVMGLFFGINALVFIALNLIYLFYVDSQFVIFKKAIGLSQTESPIYALAGIGLSIAAILVTSGNVMLVRRIAIRRRTTDVRSGNNTLKRDVRPTSRVLDARSDAPIE